MISKQAQDFWTLLKTYPKQIQMPLSQAREADTHAEDFTSEPAGVNFTRAPEVDGSLGGSFRSRSDHSLFLWRRVCAWLSRHSPQNRRPSRRRRRGRACSCRTIISRPNTLF